MIFESAHWAQSIHSVIPRRLWLLVPTTFCVQPMQGSLGSPALCCDAFKISIAALLDVGFKARLLG